MKHKDRMLKRIFSIGLIVMITLASVGAYAQEFTDVPDDHWAAGYISKVHGLDIMSGYDHDTTFRPEKNVTNLEAIVSIARLFEIDDQDVEGNIEKHSSTIDEMDLPDWAREGVSIALELEFASVDELKEILTNSGSDNVKKADVCKYLVVAMQLQEDAHNKAVVSLPFKDATEIDPKDASYIDVLIDKGIIDKSGDSKGNFNPNADVNRAVMSKLISTVYDYMLIYQKLNISFDGDWSNTPSNDGENYEDKETSIITGTITGVLKAGNMMNLKILKDGGEEELYQVASNAKAVLDGEEISIFKIVAGVIIEAVVTEDYDVLSVDATSVEEEFSGQLVSVVTGTKALVLIKNKDNENIPKMIIDDVLVYIDGQVGDLNDLEKGDLVNLKTKNDNVIKIVAESKTKEYTGILTTIDFENAPIIEIKDINESIKRFALDKDASIIRNGEIVDFIDLKVGDEIDLTTEYGEVVAIEAEVVRTENKGIVNSIVIANTSKLVVANDSGEESTYILSNDAEIKVEGKYKSIYDLRLGHEVSLELESNVIVKLDAKMVEQEFRYIGEMIYRNEATTVIMIRTIDGENILVNLTEDTKVIDVAGSQKSVKKLKVGDELLVVSISDGVTLMGKNIIIMQESQLD